MSELDRVALGTAIGIISLASVVSVILLCEILTILRRK